MIAPGVAVGHSHQASERNSKMIYHDFDTGTSMFFSTAIAPEYCTISHNYLASKAVRSLTPYKSPAQALYQSKNIVRIAPQSGHTVGSPDSTPDDGGITSDQFSVARDSLE